MRSSVVAMACTLAVAMGCGGKSEDETEPTDDPGQEGAPAPGGLEGLGGLGMFGSMLSKNANEPGPYDEPIESADFEEDEQHYAVIELTGPIVELESFSWFGAAGGVELRVLTDRLRELAGDDNVAGLVVRLSDLSIGMAAADELRAALIAFKATDAGERPIVCHTESARGLGYYLLTACDRVAIAPTGGIEISGAAAMPIHVKGLLDKVGIVADFIHVGDYKGGPEPLTRSKPSPETLRTLEAMMDTAYRTQVSAIAEARDLREAKVRALIDRALFTDREALDAELVDEIAVYESFLEQRVDTEWRRVRFNVVAEPDIGKLMEFLGIAPVRRPLGPHVALVYAVGNVVDGKGDGILGARGEIASRTLAAALRALARDDSVRAVVLRVDSPGGSALASEQILHAVREVKANKPVVVSMGGVAASGGYYIACQADKIYAQPNTLTGSIGVFGGKLVVGEALSDLGIDLYPMGKGKRATMWSMVQPWSPDERAAVRALMETTYETFLEHVASGRDKTRGQVHAVAQGRVWTGADALERGLVDEIGGLDAALAEAYRLAEVDADAELEVYPPDPTLLDFVGSLSGVSAAPLGLNDTLASLARELGPREAAVVARLFRQLELLRAQPVQAALLFPVVR